MLGIRAGMTEKDSFAATLIWPVLFLVLLVTIQFALCSLTRVWTRARCVQHQVLAVTVLKLWRSLQLQFIGQLVRSLRKLMGEFLIFST